MSNRSILLCDERRGMGCVFYNIYITVQSSNLYSNVNLLTALTLLDHPPCPRPSSLTHSTDVSKSLFRSVSCELLTSIWNPNVDFVIQNISYHVYDTLIIVGIFIHTQIITNQIELHRPAMGLFHRHRTKFR